MFLMLEKVFNNIFIKCKKKILMKVRYVVVTNVRIS